MTDVPERSDNRPDEEILADMRRVHDDLGRVPTREELACHGRFAETAYRRVGEGSHATALVSAGIVEEPPTPGTRPVPTATVFADIRRVRDDLGRWPTGNEYNARGEYTWQLLGHRLDATWAEVLERAQEAESNS